MAAGALHVSAPKVDCATLQAPHIGQTRGRQRRQRVLTSVGVPAGASALVGETQKEGTDRGLTAAPLWAIVLSPPLGRNVAGPSLPGASVILGAA